MWETARLPRVGVAAPCRLKHCSRSPWAMRMGSAQHGRGLEHQMRLRVRPMRQPQTRLTECWGEMSLATLSCSQKNLFWGAEEVVMCRLAKKRAEQASGAAPKGADCPVDGRRLRHPSSPTLPNQVSTFARSACPGEWLDCSAQRRTSRPGLAWTEGQA
jgi:hypothetical protein